jgi:hypothetical protein
MRLLVLMDFVRTTGVNFRDAMPVYEEQWEVPSGGDVSRSA